MIKLTIMMINVNGENVDADHNAAGYVMLTKRNNDDDNEGNDFTSDGDSNTPLKIITLTRIILIMTI